jgi:hypothetical protein
MRHFSTSCGVVGVVCVGGGDDAVLFVVAFGLSIFLVYKHHVNNFFQFIIYKTNLKQIVL